MSGYATEDQIQRAILDYLAVVCPGSLTFAVPNAARRTWSGKPMNPVPGLMRGAPDLVECFDEGQVVFFEVKTPTGRASAEQLDFAERCRMLGRDHFFVRSVDDVRKALQICGVETREAAE